MRNSACAAGKKSSHSHAGAIKLRPIRKSKRAITPILWHTGDVQRLCALLLLTLSLLLMLAPLASAAGERSLLPACCRRQGAHHCASAIASVADRRHAGFRSAACPAMPHSALALIQTPATLPALASLAFLACWSSFFSTGALEGYARALALKSPRGPPSLSLA